LRPLIRERRGTFAEILNDLIVQMPPIAVKILLVVTTAVIFFIDWRTPVAINLSFFYACVIVVLAWTQSRRWLWTWTLLTVALTLFELNYGNRLHEGLHWVNVINRYMTCAMLIIIAGLVHLKMLLAKRLDANKTLLDELAARKQEETLLLRKTQEELAHVTRVTTMGELAASIAHEVNQPIAGVVLNGSGCLRLLASVKEESEIITEAREALQRIIRDGTRAGEIVERIRALCKKTESPKEPLDLNEAIREVIVLARSEMDRQRVALRLELPSDLPHALGDRVQLQQVMLNLILNAIEAMAAVEGRARDLVIQTQNCEERKVLVTIRDSGMGLDAASMEQIFTAFHTTKPAGLGMGLSISRSIVTNHAGRLWVTAHDGPGASFHFALPTVSRVES